jgi:Flp pilus assembly protein TadG
MRPGTRQRGVALVELAIASLVLLSIAFGITEFGRAIYQYNTLAKAARDAARFLSMRDALDAAAKDQAKCLVVHGNPGCTGGTLVPGLTTAMVSICDALACPADHAVQGSAPVLNLVSVTIGGPNAASYVFSSLVSFIVPDIAFGPIGATMKQVL